MCCPDRAFGVRAMKTIVSALVALSGLAGIAGSASALEVSFTIPAAPDQEESPVTKVQGSPYSNTPGWARKSLRMGGNFNYESQLEMRNLRERRMRMMQHRRQMMNGGSGFGGGGAMDGRGRGR